MRQTGYYWVKTESYGWMAAKWHFNEVFNKFEWWFPGHCEDETLYWKLLEINETRILNPDEACSSH